MQFPLLAGVPGDDVRALLSIARRRTFARGEVVFHEGDPADTLHLVVSGRFAVRSTTPLGHQVTFAIVGPGGGFGELALLGTERRRAATVAALEPAETRSVLDRDFEGLTRRHPGVVSALAALLADALRRTNERLVEALYVEADRRVRRRLADLADLYDGEVPLTQEEIAGLAGTSRATVNRVLREEERRGSLELRRGRVRLLEADVARWRR